MIVRTLALIPPPPNTDILAFARALISQFVLGPTHIGLRITQRTSFLSLVSIAINTPEYRACTAPTVRSTKAPSTKLNADNGQDRARNFTRICTNLHESAHNCTNLHKCLCPSALI